MNSKISKLKPPNTLSKLPTSVLKDNNNPTQRNPTLRRSRSAITFSTRNPTIKPLKTTVIKARTVSKPTAGTIRPIVPLKSNSTTNINGTTRPTFKRPANATATSHLPPKINKLEHATTSRVPPKTANKAEQPKRIDVKPYDYKTRFTLLKEKYDKLNELYKESKSKSEELTQDHTKGIEELKVTKQKLEDTQTKVNVLTSRNHELEKMNAEKSSLIDNYKTINNDLDVENKIMKAEIKELVISSTEKDLKIESLNEINLAQSNAIIEKDECISTIKSLLKKSEDERRILHNDVQDLKGHIRIFCRIRPSKSDEQDKMLSNITFNSEKSLEIKKAKESISANRMGDLKVEFNFDRVFPPETTQEEVFEDLAQLVRSALDGYHVCVFAYGQTGSGKTYTMQGEDNNMGVIPRTINLLFHHINELQSMGWEYEIKASFLEIYNESVKDLLEPKKTNLDICFNEGRGTTVKNLKIISVNSAAILKKMMATAQLNRAVAATDFNEHSSRSHSVTKIYISGIHKENTTEFIGSINLVDLAGSESAKTSNNSRMEETKNINKSLSSLGNVMLALHNKETHIPYRNSKLTFLLQSCLGGNSKTLMFVNIAPFEECYNESINSLRFAAKVKEIKTNARKNKINK